MKILLVSGRYLPGKNGGIENYVHLLATLLLKNSHIVDVAVVESATLQHYNVEGVNVIPLIDKLNSFTFLLKDRQYDICHFHEISEYGGIELSWFQIAKQHCEKIYFTFHLPYLTCYKSDFRYKGITDCNNFSNPERCVQCIAATKLHYKKEQLVNLRNTAINLLIPFFKRTNKAIQLTNNIQLREDKLQSLLNICDTIFIIAGWFEKILFDNGYKSNKIKKLPPVSVVIAEEENTANNILKNKILFAGRIEHQKGLHLLCKAMKLITTRAITLDVFGNIADEKYYAHCQHEYAFNYKGVLDRTALLRLLKEYDFLVLPSMFTEMYSMILQEAIAEKLPVIASSAKGNVDIIKPGQNGFLFEYGDYRNLAHVIDHSYHLKKNGWKPTYKTNSEEGNNISEILSYY